MDNMKLIILTQSSEHKKNCVVGIEVTSGRWIRLVSDERVVEDTVTEEDVVYKDGSKCNIFDIVNVRYLNDDTKYSLPENIIIDNRYYMRKEGSATIEEVLRIHPVEQNQYLLGNRNIRIKESFLPKMSHSLTLIEAYDLTFHHCMDKSGVNRIRLGFYYNSVYYEDMPVTDPEYMEVMDGSSMASAYMIVSAGPIRREYCYKCVVRIFKR